MPYPLNIPCLPWYLEHVLGFGILEALITALIFAYIQRTDSSLLYGERICCAEEQNEEHSPSMR